MRAADGEIDRQYEEFLVDLPYCGGKHNMMIWQLYDAVAAFAYYEVLPEKETPEEFTKNCAVTFEKDKQRRTLPHFLTVDSKGFVRLVRAAIRPIAKKMNRKLDSGEWQDGWRSDAVHHKKSHSGSFHPWREYRSLFFCGFRNSVFQYPYINTVYLVCTGRIRPYSASCVWNCVFCARKREYEL